MIRPPKKVIRVPTDSGAWTTTSIATRYLVALLDDAGKPPDDLLTAAGVAREALGEADLAMPLLVFRELWARAAAVQPDIGITMVERFPAGQMHFLAHLALRSATMQGAIDDVCRYGGTTSPADRMSLATQGELARFGYASRAPGPDNPWIAEHYLSMAILFLNQATGRALPIRAVRFAAAAQAPAQAYRRRFGLDPEFAGGRNEIEFDAGALAWPMLTHDAYLHDILERVAQARTPATTDAWLEDVRRTLAQGLLTGTTPTLDAVAAAQRMSPRALRDRLAQQRTNFRQLLDQVRRDLARDHLAGGLSVNETAYLLGFSEPAAFQHACKRWFARSAGRARKSLVDKD